MQNNIKTNYSTISNRQLDIAPKYDVFLIDKHLKSLTIESAGLELGCGSGHLLRQLYRKGFTRLTGVDLSNEDINYAKKNSPPDILFFNEEAIIFLKNEIQKNHKYDFIIAIDLIEHLAIENVYVFFDCIKTLLRPGGMLLIHQPNGLSPFSNSVLYGDITHKNAYTPSSIRQLCNLNGLYIQKFEEDPILISGIKSLCRFIIWNFILRPIIKICYLVQNGTAGEFQVYSQNFLAVIKK